VQNPLALVQLRLLPLYRQLEFGPSFWAFTFCWAAVTALGLRWLQIEDPPHASLYAGLAAGAVSLLVAVIAAASVAKAVRARRRPA
jgi:tellurite resistance protein